MKPRFALFVFLLFVVPAFAADDLFDIKPVADARKSRTVEILWLGRAHTDGDVFVFLRKEKVLCTGDALHGWTPFMGDSYPYDWIKTLDAAEKLGADSIIAETAT